MSYAELQITSNFSFLRGASHPEEFVKQAKELGYYGLGIADRNTLAGVVRAHAAAREAQIKVLIGARLDFADGTPSIICYPKHREAYGRLSALLTTGKCRGLKGECLLYILDIQAVVKDCVWIVTSSNERVRLLKKIKTSDIYLAAQFLFGGNSARELFELAKLSEESGIPLVATNDAHAHDKNRRILQDVLTCIRKHSTIDEAGIELVANAERYLKSPDEMARLFSRYPQAVSNSINIVDSCNFSLEELRYEYPDALCPPDVNADQYLAQLAQAGALRRYPGGVPSKVKQQIIYELQQIAKLKYAPYFLTVYDIVKFARSQNILCQGRGSAANSAVCYCIGITAVDPTKMDMLFERFISSARNEPPDIDVDFEHERREEVMQYIYQKYGRDHAGIAGTVITYRTKSAVRDIGKVLGLSLEVIEGVLRDFRSSDLVVPCNKRVALLLSLVQIIRRFPRHLSQHVGGFVITKGLLSHSVPIGNAAMPDRTFIEWDKDDLDSLGMLKIDVLALGMLSCISRSFALIEKHYHRSLCLATIPTEDAQVYEMLSSGDSVGVFQVESRAQMSMLPRLRPKCFYDLVIEVAIVRPGPIQGGMVHPYLKRRNGEEQVEYPSTELKEVLHKTLGVPLFQEQAMRIAVVAAGFTPDEADLLRRSMAAFRRTGQVHAFEGKFISGMLNKGYTPEFSERCFSQILGFGDYGFPESHAASFALLVYASAWLKFHYPEVFACALLNSQPMGFYASAQLIADAQRHEVEVLPVEVNSSGWENGLVTRQDSGMTRLALRLGLREIKGFSQKDAEWIVACRGSGYKGPSEVAERSGVSKRAINLLARADAFAALNLSRRESIWAANSKELKPLPLFAGMITSAEEIVLPPMSELQEVIFDYKMLGLSLKQHPMAFLRDDLRQQSYFSTHNLAKLANGQAVKVAGVVIIRQRPPTAKGVIFQTIEDENGFANIVIWPKVYETYKAEALFSTVVAVEGRLQRQGKVIHVIAEVIRDIAGQLNTFVSPSRDFH